MKRIFKSVLFKISHVNIAIYLFIGAALLSGAGTLYYNISLAKALYYFATGALLYFLVTSVKLDIKKITGFLQYVMIVAFLVAAYGLVTFITKKDFLFGDIYSQNVFFSQILHFNIGRILSSLGHPDFLGGYLAMLSPLFLFKAYSCQIKCKKYIAWLSYLIVMSAIFLTFSGGAYLAAIVSNSTLIFFLKKNHSSGVNKAHLFYLLGPIIILTISFIIMILVVVLNKQSMNDDIFKILNLLFHGRVKFEELLNLQPLAARIDSFKIALNIFKTNPLVGIGIGNISSGRYVLDKLAMDNMYLSIISESGLAGILTFLFLNFIVLKRLLVYSKNIIVGESKLMILTLFTCLTAFLIDSFYWDTLYHPTLRMLYWLIIAIAVVITNTCEID
jgi:O-antigen ligase